MSVVYRKTWTAANGHTYTLDIVPYDTDVNGSVVNLSAADANLIEVGTVAYAFDELPIGLMTPPSMTITVVMNRLPSALQTYLRAKYGAVSGTPGYITRNTFILKSDFGITGDTNIVFVGVQSKINSQTYNRVSGEYTVDIELVDAMQWTLSSIKPADSTDWTGLSDISRIVKRKAFEFRAPNSDGLYDSVYDTDLTTLDERLTFHTWSQAMASIWQYIGDETKKMSLRCDSVLNIADYNSSWQSDKALTITQLFDAEGWTPASGRPRVAQLDNDDVYLCTHITQGGATIGGLASAQDKYGWSRYESWWDFFKDMAETMFCKVSYYYAVDTIFEPGSIYVWWRIDPVITTNVSNVDVLDSLDEPVITETESAIGRCETRFSAEYGEATATQHVANAGVTRADRQFTVDLPMHNLPLFKGRREGLSFGGNNPYIAEPGLQHCNLFWYYDGSEIVKVHENMRIRWGATSSDVFDYDEAIADNPPFDPEAHSLWAIEVQRTTGMNVALAGAYVRTFGQDDLATVELRTRLTDYQFVVGNRHTLTGTITTDIPHLAWGNAIVTSVETNVIEGTQTVKFTLIPIPS